MEFLDIILFALIAAFLVLRLRNVLGRKGGHEGGHQDPFTARHDQDRHDQDHHDQDRHDQDRHDQDRHDREKTEDNVVHLPDHTAPDADGPASPEASEGWPEKKEDLSPDQLLAGGLARIEAADPAFSSEEFISGTRIAFDLVLGAYAAGETRTLKPLLSAEVFGNFSQAIRSREQAGETMDDTLIGIKNADIAEAYMEGSTALVTIKFVSEQINVVRDENGDVIDGDPTAIAEVTDFWTFARDTQSRDPNWTLVATRSLE